MTDLRTDRMLANNLRRALNIGYVSTALIYTGTTLTIGAAVASCVILGGGNPLSISLCVTTAVGTLLTYAGKYLAHTYSLACLMSSTRSSLIKLVDTTRRTMAVCAPTRDPILCPWLAARLTYVVA